MFKFYIEIYLLTIKFDKILFFTLKQLINKVKSQQKRDNVPFSEKGTIWRQMRNRRRIVDTCLLIPYRRR